MAEVPNYWGPHVTEQVVEDMILGGGAQAIESTVEMIAPDTTLALWS